MATSSFLLYLSIFLAVFSVSNSWFFGNYDDDYSPPDVEEQPGCNDVFIYFLACQDYLTGDEDSPPSTCCYNLHVLNSISKEEGPRRICQCIEDLQVSFRESRIKKIYKKCDIHLSFPISERMNCSSV